MPMFKLSRPLLLTLILTGVLISSAHAQSPEQRPSLTAMQCAEEGERYFRERQYDKAVDSFRQAIKLDPNLAAAYHGLGRVYVNMGRASDALEPLKTAVRLEPNNSFVHLNLAIALENLRRFDEALTELNEAKRLSPNDARNYHELGNLLNNFLGRIDDALAAYLEARRLDPNDAAIHHNIGLMLIQLGRVGEALVPLQVALRLEPRYRNARYLLSDAYGILGRYDEAAKSWGKFLELVPDGPEALTKRSWSYIYLGGHGREAAADARRYLEAHGWQTRISTYMAILGYFGYLEAGMEQDAQTILDEATTKDNAGGWPSTIVRYLKGEIAAEELLQLATDNDRKTEAHAYIGLALQLKSEGDEARTHFEWVREYGNKRFYEYPLALAELKRLGR
jgi:tetratricopeptide (TPR) repeat protein